MTRISRSNFDSSVLIVGAGPVGLALACDLGWRGVATLIVDQGTGSAPRAKTSGVNMRTMEFCRRWGLREKIRSRGLVPDYPRDRIWLTALNGFEIARQRVPSLRDETPPRGAIETFMRIHQTEFDPILQEFALACPSVQARYQTLCTGVEQDDSGVTATVENLQTGHTSTLRAGYVVSCEGAGSEIRKTLGIPLEGDWNVNSSTNAYFRSSDFLKFHDKGRGLIYSFIGPEGYWAYIFAINGTDLWQVQIRGLGSKKPTASADEVCRLIRRAAGCDFDFELLDVMPWTRRQLLAEHYRDRRIFLAGDAVHQMPPTATLGMNTGVGDATNLSWKLDAVLSGWGGARLLDTYESERRPIADRASAMSLRLFRSSRVEPPGPQILEDTPTGSRARVELGSRLLAEAAHPSTEGFQIGFHYRESPICWEESGVRPAESNEYRPTTYPGARAPDAWLAANHPLLDHFGRGFVLVQFRPGDQGGTDRLSAAAKKRGMPLSVLEIHDDDVAALYERRFVLVRPDGHVAWRGDEPPSDPLALVDRLRGAAPDPAT